MAAPVPVAPEEQASAVPAAAQVVAPAASATRAERQRGYRRGSDRFQRRRRGLVGPRLVQHVGSELAAQFVLRQLLGQCATCRRS